MTKDHAVTLSPAARKLLTGVAVALGLVILAPILLSGQDLYQWAHSTRGLNLAPGFAVLAPVALDVAAAACIGMVVLGAVWRRERPGVFGVLVWVFALTSAWAQYRHGMTERAAGRAQDAWWAFPALALLGPTLLECTLYRVRRWARQDAAELLSGAAGFGARWIPGVAARETLRAWAASRREGIATAAAAIAHVRERDALAELSPVDAVRYAYDALGSVDPYAARVWLQARGRIVDQAAIDAATPAAELPAGPAELDPPAELTAAPAAVVDVDQAAAVELAAPVSPAVPDDLTAVSKTTAVAYAHVALGQAVPASRVIEWLSHRGVTVSEALVYKTRRALPAWAAPSGELPMYVPAELAAAPVSPAPINGHASASTVR